LSHRVTANSLIVQVRRSARVVQEGRNS
jgi:hypothetical protein